MGLHFGPVPPLEGRARLVSGEAARDDPLLQGRVRFPSGQPVAGAQVMLFDLDGLHRVAAAATDESGWFSLTAQASAPALPERFHLGQNYPNPFNPSTVIPYELPAAARVRLEVFNLLGQRVATLVDEERPAGSHSARWDGTDSAGRAVGAGVYLYRLQGGGMSATRRMLLIDGQAGIPASEASSGGIPEKGREGVEALAPVFGLTVSGPGLITHVNPAFRIEAGGGPVDLVVQKPGLPRGKVAASGLPGDVDNNGRVDVVDALLVALYILDSSLILPNNGDISRGDVNSDGRIDVADLWLILTNYVLPEPAPSGKMYWTAEGPPRIQRADLDGSNIEDLVTTGLVNPRGLALDAAGRKMYWLDRGTGKLQRADLDGSNVEDLVTFGSPRNLALDMLAGKMYWTDTGTRKIWRADLDGSRVESLISSGLISPVGLALDVDAGKMYWTDTGSNRIQRANLDGSRIEYLVSLGLHSPEGLALDADGGKIYWSDYGTDKIQRANLDGSQVEDLVTSGLRSPGGLALDVSAGKIYWTDYSADKIQRANLDGSQVEDLVTAGLSIPRDLALEAAAGKIYWTDSGTGKIQRANLDGSQVEDLLSASESSAPLGLALASPVAALSPNPETTFPRDGFMRRFTVLASEPVVVVANPAGTPSRMLVAESSGAFNECPAQREDSLRRRHGQTVYLGGCTPGQATVELRRASDQAVLKTYAVRVSGKLKMYWTNAGRNDKIQRADIDGTNVEDLVTTGLSEPIDLALDVTGGKMYWTDQGTDKIQRADLDGTGVEDLLTTGLFYPVGLALDLIAGKMYWTDMDADKIKRANLDGSNVEDLVTTGLSRPRGIALDLAAGKMYWTDQGTDKIQRADLDGSNIEDLVTSGTNDLDRLALDPEAGKIYWTDARAGKVQRANLDGSDVEDLVTGLGVARGIALDLAGGRMYWTDSGTDRIQSANLDGSNIQTPVTGMVGPTSIALE